MKKFCFFSLAVLFFALAGFRVQAQNLRDNPDYRKGLELQALARQSYDEGDYDKSVEHSAAAQEYFQKARDYADLMALRYTANNLKNRAADRLHYADYIHADQNFPNEYAAALAASKAADAAFSSEDYRGSITGYQATLELLKDIAPVTPAPSAELAKAEELRNTISVYGFDKIRPTETQRGDTAYSQGKDRIGQDNGQAKLMLDNAIKNYQEAINLALAFVAGKRRTELAEAKGKADEVNAARLAPDTYANAQKSEKSAEANLFAGAWTLAWSDSEAALKGYNDSYAAALASGKVKPEYYTVRLIPRRRDCLWRIAGYDFVYGDPWKWRLLYEENKGLLKDPNNPRIIEPGMRIRIPSLEGEIRVGDWKDPQTR
jgi:nucleoid-associated protein YgaU